MKNIDPYLENSFQFYKDVCQKKRNSAGDPTYKDRLLNMDANISDVFNLYDAVFESNTLESLNPHGYVDPDRSDLHKLYKFNSAPLQMLKTTLTTSPTGRKVQCQNCTMNEVNSLDHIIPREQFPEFSVNPKNLFPCCSKCNSYKGQIWRTNGIRTSLNLYLDELPDVQYLFVNAEIGYNYIQTEFYLDNRNGIDADLFKLISNHYTNLRLLERFSEGADDVITSFKNVIEPALNRLSLFETRNLSKSIIEKDRIAFGSNYWQSVLKLELIDNDDFLIDFE